MSDKIKEKKPRKTKEQKTTNIDENKEIDYITNDIKELKVNNKGTGAGGAQTNMNGLKFEHETDIIPKLLELGYKKNNI
jgi:hypothetical protein